MRIWAVANQKGGVGKTTTTVALASLLADQGHRVLMLDLDPQGSLSSYFRLDPEMLTSSSFDLFVPFGQLNGERVKAIICPTPYENLHLMPASTALATLERKATSQEGMGLAVSRALTLVWDDYDYVIVDSPPTLGVLLINAIAACEQIIVPVQTEFLAIKGLERMMHTLEMITRSRRKPLACLLVPTLFDRRTQASVSSLLQLRNRYPDRLWRAAIPVDTRLRDASARGVTPLALDRSSRGVRAYGSLLRTLLAADAMSSSSTSAQAAEASHG